MDKYIEKPSIRYICSFMYVSLLLYLFTLFMSYFDLYYLYMVIIVLMYFYDVLCFSILKL